jgi:lysozyme family protein
MADFLAAQPYVMINEGGYANLTGDTGGETYAGISRNNFPDWAGWEIIDNSKPIARGAILPELNSAVNQFYKPNFWDGIKGDGITEQNIAVYVYDFYVHAEHNAAKVVQRTIGVTADGIFGNGSLNALNDAGDCLAALHDARVAYYNEIGVGNNARFLQGWLNRANNLYDKLS